MRHWVRVAGWVVALALAWPTGVLALQVKPMIFDMSVVGSEAHKTITVINTAATPMPVELVINRLDLGPNGEMLSTPGGQDDFIIFPPQTTIPPNATQTFRVQWSGDPDLPASRSYNIAVNQLPVQGAKQAEGTHLSLQLTFSFLTTVTVRPAQGMASFHVRGVEATKTKDSKSEKPAVALKIENTGNLHNYLSNATLTLQAGSWSRTLSPEQIHALSGPGLVLPNHTRRIVIPIDDLPKKPGPMTASLDFGK
jgi:fimbrial chaperone protein